jgi:hypothetical protein
MSNQQLEAKFTDLTSGILSSERNRRLIDACWHIEKLDSAAAIAQAAVPA